MMNPFTMTQRNAVLFSFGAGVVFAVVCGVSYYFWKNRTRSGISGSLKDMIEKASKSYLKGVKEGKKVPSKDLKEAALALGKLKFKKGDLRRTVNAYTDLSITLHAYHCGEVSLSPSAVTQTRKELQKAAKALLAKKFKEADQDDDDEKSDGKEVA